MIIKSMNNQKLISVIIPCYNQYESLMIVLRSFSNQSLNKNKFEIIVVDDGSSDDTVKINSNFLFERFGIYGQVIHTINQGRAKARNVGINKSISKYICFCDGDRFVAPTFLEEHIKCHQKGQNIVIGCPMDYYGNTRILKYDNFNWNHINKLSRVNEYFKKIETIYTNNKTNSNLAWLSFLVGNSSVSKRLLELVHGFNENFVEWGFEHFELALRMQEVEKDFYLNKLALSYHIPHKRENNFYEIRINQNINILKTMHTNINEDVMAKILLNNININECENVIFLEEKNEQKSFYE